MPLASPGRIPALPFCHARLQGSRPLSHAYPQALVTIGDHIRKRRLDLKLRQRDVADRLGTNPGTITNWELGHTEPEIRFLPDIIRFLGYAPITEPTTIADQIRLARQLRGLSQQKMAKILGLDPGTVARYERGIRRPRGKYLHRVEDLLGQLLALTKSEN
jgi:transcriptional regulator with XRE-family HTH domain